MMWTLKSCELGALENGAADADHAGLDLVDRHDRRGRARKTSQKGQREPGLPRQFECSYAFGRWRGHDWTAPERPPQSVIESNRLQVKNKAAIVSRTLRDLFTLCNAGCPGTTSYWWW